VIAQRMFAAVQAARVAAEGPRGGLRLAPAADLDAAPVRGEEAPLARPAPPQCGLASLTSFGFEDAKVVGIDYSEPAAHLVALSTAPIRQGAVTVAPPRRPGRPRPPAPDRRAGGRAGRRSAPPRGGVECRPTSAPQVGTSPASCSTAAPTTCRGPRQGRRGQLLGFVVPPAGPSRRPGKTTRHQGQGRHVRRSTRGTTGTPPRRSSAGGSPTRASTIRRKVALKFDVTQKHAATLIWTGRAGSRGAAPATTLRAAAAGRAVAAEGTG
jgi:hypothetical protein